MILNECFWGRIVCEIYEIVDGTGNRKTPDRIWVYIGRITEKLKKTVRMNKDGKNIFRLYTTARQVAKVEILVDRVVLSIR